MEWWSTKGLIRQGPLNATTLEDTFCLTDSNEEIQKLIRQVFHIKEFLNLPQYPFALTFTDRTRISLQEGI